MSNRNIDAAAQRDHSQALSKLAQAYREGLLPKDLLQADYSSGSYSQDTPLIHPYRLDCGIHAANGLDYSFLSYIGRKKPSPKGFEPYSAFPNGHQ